MNIELSSEEYRTLLDLLYIADWVLHAHKDEVDPRTERSDALVQKLYGLAEQAGYKTLIKPAPGSKELIPTNQFEDETQAWEFINEFTEDMFWDELIHRLTDRDLARRVGGYDQLDAMDMQERFKIESPVINRYADELDEHGVERLEIVEHFGPPLFEPGKTSD